MRSFKTLKFLTAGGLLLSLSSMAQAQVACSSVLNEQKTAVPNLTPQMMKALETQVKAQIQAQLIQYASIILKVPITTVIATKKVSVMQVKDLGETGAAPQEMMVLAELAKLNAKGELRPSVLKLLAALKSKADQVPQLAPLKNLKPEQEEFLVATLISNVEGLLALRGMTPTTATVKYTEWPALSAAMQARLDQSPAGLENILYFAEAKPRAADQVKILVNGPASFAMRDSLMAKAKKSIDILSWAVYSDMTGFAAAELLIQKHQEGVHVRVVIDGQVAAKAGYTEAVQKMEKAGIEVVRWISKTHSFEGQHRKMMIIDGEHIIAGGLNFGDVYSHKNPDLKIPRWRDTDVYLHGEVVAEGMNLFARVWNEQVRDQKLAYAPMTEKQLAVEPSVRDGDMVAVLDHNPSQLHQQGSTIMMTLLKGIREAKETVEIENAYVVLFPALKNEIAAAVARGVKVRVFTNSATSVDEPIVSIPILRSAFELSSVGAEVYLKKGATLHSKLAVFDGKYTMIQSYNLHPRSERVEEEMAMLILSKSFAQEVRAVFEADIQADLATKVERPEDIQIPDSGTALPILRIFFDML
jgi:cardiolipin synthase